MALIYTGVYGGTVPPGRAPAHGRAFAQLTKRPLDGEPVGGVHCAQVSIEAAGHHSGSRALQPHFAAVSPEPLDRRFGKPPDSHRRTLPGRIRPGPWGRPDGIASGSGTSRGKDRDGDTAVALEGLDLQHPEAIAPLRGRRSGNPAGVGSRPIRFQPGTLWGGFLFSGAGQYNEDRQRPTTRRPQQCSQYLARTHGAEAKVGSA